jgi:hypothetical protein
VTRRPKSRLPPKLPDPGRGGATRSRKQASARERLKEGRATGRSAHFGRDEIVRVMHALVRGDPDASLGVPQFEGVTTEHVRAAARLVFGWDVAGNVRIDPTCTVDGFQGATARVLEVARAGGRLAFATARPASLFHVHRALASAATAVGGTVLDGNESAPVDRSGRRLWWIDGVAMVTDGESLLAEDPPAAAEEFLFLLPSPDLVVADRTFAGRALAGGLEVVAFADLDAMALAVAAWRGMAVRIVPIDERRPPRSYEPLLELLDRAVEEVLHEDPSAADPLRPSDAPGSRSDA